MSKLKLIPSIKFWIFEAFGLAFSVCKIKSGSEIIDFRANGFVFISDGYSSDALPVFLCSQKIIDEISKRISMPIGDKP